MAAEKIYARAAGFVAANLGDELALLDMADGTYLGFNATAAHLWRLLDQPMTLEALCEAMLAEFDVSPDQCRDEIAALLDRLAASGIVTIDDVA